MNDTIRRVFGSKKSLTPEQWITAADSLNDLLEGIPYGASEKELEEIERFNLYITICIIFLKDKSGKFPHMENEHEK